MNNSTLWKKMYSNFTTIEIVNTSIIRKSIVFSSLNTIKHKCKYLFKQLPIEISKVWIKVKDKIIYKSINSKVIYNKLEKGHSCGYMVNYNKYSNFFLMDTKKLISVVIKLNKMSVTRFTFQRIHYKTYFLFSIQYQYLYILM